MEIPGNGSNFVGKLLNELYALKQSDVVGAEPSICL